MCEEDENSPAVTLELWREGSAEADLSIDVVPALEVLSQRLPAAARAGPNVDSWLGKNARGKLCNLGCYFVPKMPKGSSNSDMVRGMFLSVFWEDSFCLPVASKALVHLRGHSKEVKERRTQDCTNLEHVEMV